METPTSEFVEVAPEPAIQQELVVVPTYEKITAQAGIDFVHVNGATGERLLPETMGGGVAFFDFENDGDQDLLLVNSQSWPWDDASDVDSSSALYLNDGTGSFERKSDPALETPLYGMGVAVGDYDGDGFLDLYITAVGTNRLLRNVNGQYFEDVTSFQGVGGSIEAWSTCAAFFDYDRDDDLDLFVCNYVEWSRERDQEVDYRLAGIGRAYGPPTDFAGTNAFLFRNDGDEFTDVSEDSGLEVLSGATGEAVGKALGVVVLDLNGDRYEDLIIANDTVRNFVFENQRDGTFSEIGIEQGIAFDTGGLATGAMGIDFAHVDNNDNLAIAIGNFANEMSSFYVRREGQSTFFDDSIIAGVGAPSRRALTFGLLFLDYDLDGFQDLLAANGHVEPEINRVQSSQKYRQTLQLWWNCGGDCTRRFLLVDSVESTWGQALVARGAASADIDVDGDLDFIVTQIGGPPLLLRNDSALDSHWIRIQLRQKPPNVFGLGATVVLTSNESRQTRHVSLAKSYLSSVELPLTFGLGSSIEAVDVSVRWPDGTHQLFEQLETDEEHTLIRIEGTD